MNPALLAGSGLFWLLNGCIAGLAYSLACRSAPQRGLDLAIRTFTLYFFLIVFTLTLLGALHLLYLPVVVALSLVLGLIGFFLKPRKDGSVPDPASAAPPGFLSRVLILIQIFAVAALYLVSILYPHFPHDPLTYHLVFPVEWMQRHGLVLVPTPFGDPSRAYDAANAGIYFLWLLLPLGHDQFAQAGQFPLFVLCLLALTGISQELKIKPPWVYLPSALFILNPLAAVQASMAFNDLAVAAFFLAALYFTLRFRSSSSAGDLCLAGISLGLLAGVKYLALLHAGLIGLILILILPQPLREKRIQPRHLALFGFLILLAGGYWYLRNLWRFGNPIYPLQVQLFGYTLFPGAYDHAVMTRWLYHQAGLRDLKNLLFQLVSPPLLIAILPALVAAPILAWRARLRPKDWIPSAVLALPVVIHLLLWFVNPFQIDRFWFPAFALALVPLAWLAGFSPALGWAIGLLCLGDLATRPWFGLTYPTYWKIHLALVAAGVVAAMLAGRAPQVFQPRNTSRLKVLGVALAILASMVSQPTYLARRAEFLFTKWKPGTAWQWLWSQPGPLRLAYTGTNLVYPLFGPRLENQVRYLAINAHPDRQFHDYEKALRPLQANTPEPAPERLEWDLPAWWQNLVQAEVQYLVIAGVGKNLRPNIAHDSEFWPIEDQWARARPQLFEPVFQNPTTRIYRVHPEITPEWSDSDRQVTHQPIDAVAAYAQSNELGKTFFPQAPPILKKLK